MASNSSTRVRPEDVARLCIELQVKRLEKFGAAADAAFIVEFLPGAEKPWMAEYSGLIEGLEALYGREVDLLRADAIPGSHSQEYCEWVESTRAPIYEA